ncbi:hypothetical protein VA7868_01448 [Vibrio aerogenes CECT 7868]|uniref:Uncharacterized protein n=1 Tax=Vibrio aerogenes CECT 7868 TaxID=1216006 RepID=A0A1M5Y293_9VIBR|nr:hypothetical protein [Vibrio aerogenes]SHI06132.1 hypothetical protein VA7868_01448 [Vibrio aerogenes CECT 7868]
MIKYASAPACDGKMFFIGVTGFDHPTTQDFLFYSLDNMYEQEYLGCHLRHTEQQMSCSWTFEPVEELRHLPLEQKKKTDKKLLNHTIYSWDWREESEARNVWLKVDTESGEPIRLPLFGHVSATERQVEEQLYQMQSFIPLSVLPSEKGTVILPWKNSDGTLPIVVNDNTSVDGFAYDAFGEPNDMDSENQSINMNEEENRTVPVRNGYVYIAYKNRIWRELEVTSEEGAPCFRDINLFAYRGNKDRFQTNVDRKATGSKLQEIWYPSRENGAQTNVLIAFSEVQWSGSRLNFLEGNLDEMKKRMISPLDQIRKIDEMPAVRAREPELELQLCEPVMLSRDLSGKILEQVFNEAKWELFNFCIFDKYSPQLNQYEYCARCAVLGEKYRLDKEKGFPGKVVSYDAPGEWQASALPDYFADARTRKLTGVILPDPLYNLRHQATVLQSCSNYLNQLQMDAMNQPFYKSAHLLQIMVFSPELGDMENPAYEHKDLVDLSPYGVFAKTLRLNPRKQTRSAMFSLQKKVLALLKEPEFTHALKDILSLDDTNRYGGYILVNNCINNLLLCPDIADKLLPKHDYCIKNDDVILEVANLCLDDSPGSLFEALCGSKQTGNSLMQAMHQFETDKHKTAIPVNQEISRENNGSGILNIDEMTWQEISHLAPEKLKVPETALLHLMNNNQGESPDLFPQARRMINLIDSAIGCLFNTAQTLHHVMQNTSNHIVKLKFNKLHAKSFVNMKFFGRDATKSMHFRPANKNIAGFECHVIGIGINGKMEGIDFDIEPTKYGGADPKVLRAHGHFENEAGDVLAATAKSKVNETIQIQKNGKRASAGKQHFNNVEVVMAKDAEVARMLTDHKSTVTRYMNGNKKAINPKKWQHIGLPAFFMAIEAINCFYAYSYLINNYKKDTAYALTNVFSATLDISLAGVNHINRLCSNTGMLYNMSEKSVCTFSKAAIQRFSCSKLVSFRLVNQITVMGALSCLAGIVTAGLLAWDACHMWSRMDYDAAIGCGIMALGTLAGAVGGMLIETSATFLGLGPVGWITGLVVLIGFIIYVCFKDEPIEIWIKHGPFTRDDPNDYAFLRTSPDDAYLQLLSLFASINIKAGNIQNLLPRVVWRNPTTPDVIQSDLLPYDDVIALMSQKYSHYVYVSSGIAQLLNPGDDELKLSIYFVEAVREIKTKDFYRSDNIIKGHRIMPDHEINLSQGKGRLYFFKEKHFRYKHSARTFYKGRFPDQTKIEHQHIIWSFAQVRWGDYIFPQPSLDQMEELIEEKDAVLNSCHMSPVFQEGCKENYYWKISTDQID